MRDGVNKFRQVVATRGASRSKIPKGVDGVFNRSRLGGQFREERPPVHADFLRLRVLSVDIEFSKRNLSVFVDERRRNGDRSRRKR